MKRIPIVIVFILGLVGQMPAGIAEELKILAQPGPWPVADGLIRYRGKIWFSTAVKGVNHNSADVWSFDPSNNNLKFERYLFSQDTGNPVVHKGLLYWPHEDMRVGLGAGVISVTNGREWQNISVPVDDYMMHTHGTAEWNGTLVATMAGWNSALSTSSDSGRTWQVLVNEPPRVGRFHRYNYVASLGARLFARHWEKTGVTLSEFKDSKMIDVKGWPEATSFSNFVRFKNSVYSIVQNVDGTSDLWRIGTSVPERLVVNTGSGRKRLLVSDDEALWIITQSANSGKLWSSNDGKAFRQRHTYSGGIPHSAIALSPGKIYLGGEGAGGNAQLWGPSVKTQKPAERPIKALPGPKKKPITVFNEAEERSILMKALADPEMYNNRGRPLRLLLAEILSKGPPDLFFSDFLNAPIPEGKVATFGGRFQVTMQAIANWQLLNAMAENNEKRVPVRFLGGPWKQKPNGPQKWLDELLMAMHVVQRVNQSDRATLEALMGRLNFRQDPEWLQSQVTGTLTALTGKPFAYDRSKWQDWWQIVKKDWPELPGRE